jgi:hypothetical protein
MAVAFDTLEVSKRLKGAGFDDAQAEAITGVLRAFARGGPVEAGDKGRSCPRRGDAAGGDRRDMPRHGDPAARPDDPPWRHDRGRDGLLLAAKFFG